MKKEFVLIILTLWFMDFGFAQNPPQDKNWEVVFEDNFNTFNTGRWWKEHNVVKGEYNPNKDKYDENPHIYLMENVYTSNGKLVLEAKRLANNLPCPKDSANCQYKGWHKYTSGAIVSESKYKYGYFEIYAKLPSGTAFFPAFWLWNANKTPPNCFYNEIDIMEANGCPTEANWVSSNFQATFDCTTRDRVAIKHPLNYTDGLYHWYGAEWDRDKITWYVDHKAVRQISNNLHGIGIQNPMQLIINLSLFPPTWNKCSFNDALFPAYMYVDQCNVYRLKCDKDTVVNEILNYNTFNYAVKKSISLSSISSLSSGANVSLRATDYIELKAGFEVPLGAELYLDVNPCE